MAIPTSLIVVRIMPNQENSRVNPAVIFDNFCNSREKKYVFGGNDLMKITPLIDDAVCDSDVIQLKGDKSCHYAAMIEQDRDGGVVRMGIARVQFIRVSKSEPGSGYGIKPIGEPIVLERESKASASMYQAAFAHLENIISFSPESPRKDGFVSIVKAPSLVQAVALLLADRTSVLSTKGAFEPLVIQAIDGLYPCFAQRDGFRYPLFEEDEAIDEEDGTDDTEDVGEGLRLRDRRGGFQLDFDRVVHAKSYRRLVDKAQVYSSEKGDHYRTRMTHTQVVMQIARSIASSLGANELLTSTIALAHDLGHTPFGHEGERVLKEKLDGLSEAIGFYLGGFKHNFQSVRVLSLLDETHIGYVGSNVSWQVLEGVLWHTRVAEKAFMTDEVGTLRCAFGQMDPLYFEHRDYFDSLVFHVNDESYVETGCSHSLTVEGQIVAIADEIAQRSHDVDDAISAGLFTVEELYKLVDHFSYKRFGKEIGKIKDDIRVAQDAGRMFVSPDDVLRSRVASIIIRYLIQDVCRKSAELLKGSKLDERNMIHKKAVDFSDAGHVLNAYLETIVMNRVLASSEVTRSDERGARIVEKLFDAYYANPKLLPESALRRLVIMEKAMGCADVVDLSLASSRIAAREFSSIKDYGRLTQSDSLLPESKKSDDLETKTDEIGENREDAKQSSESDVEKKKRWHQFAKSSVQRMNELYNNPTEMNEGDNSYLVKHVFLIRVIVDHIAGMTDSYAGAEYHRLIVD